jgi:hypothetical protein
MKGRRKKIGFEKKVVGWCEKGKENWKKSVEGRKRVVERKRVVKNIWNK